MYLDLKQLFEVLGERIVIDYAIDLSEYELFDTKPFSTPVAVKGEAKNRSGVVTVSYECDFTMNLLCDRCLKSFSRRFCESFEHTLVVKTAKDGNEYIEVGHQPRLLLDDLVLSDILLAMPSKILCKEDCRGLCSSCGADLNEGDCNCINN